MEWKDIIGYEELYKISDNGDVLSLNYNHTGKEKLMKGKIDRYGYKVVGLRKNGKRKHIPVHRLVAISFLGNVENMTVNHIDGDKKNNNKKNLEWCTNAENLSHGHKMHLFDKAHEASRKRAVQVKIKHRENGNVLQFNSLTEASKALKCNISSVCGLMHNRIQSLKGYVRI